MVNRKKWEKKDMLKLTTVLCATVVLCTFDSNLLNAVEPSKNCISDPTETMAEKLTLLEEKTDCLAQTLGELRCKDLYINSCVQDHLLRAKNGFFVQADFLYWQADEDGLEYATHDKGIILTQANPSPPVSDRLLGLNFEWNPGFRVGIGGTSCGCDHWGLLLDYTYIYNKAKGSINLGTLSNLPDQFLTPGWDPLLMGIYATAANAQWSVHYSTEVLEGFRNFFLGKNLLLKPHMGLLNANINQNYHAAYRLPSQLTLSDDNIESHLHAKCNYWGLGIRGGADLFWHFTKNFGLYGEFSAGLVYGKFSVSRNGDSFIPISQPLTPYTFKFNKKMWRTRTTLQTALGLEWETTFNRDRNRIAISLGYEFNEWFRQNQFVQSYHQPTDDKVLVIYNFADADLAFQGGTLRATFNF